MKKPSLIKVFVYAKEDYTSQELTYGLYTQFTKSKAPLSLFEDKIVAGAYDEETDIYIAENNCRSLNDLVNALQEGATAYSMLNFKFFFDFPDHLNVGFWRKNDKNCYTAAENCLYRERPLSENERNQFAMAFMALSIK